MPPRYRPGLPLLMVIVALAVAGLSASPGPQWFAGQDKLHHVAGLFVFAVALLYAFPRLRGWHVAGVGLGVAAAIEISQALWLPQRTGSWPDLLAGVFGAWLGWLAWRGYLRLRALRAP